MQRFRMPNQTNGKTGSYTLEDGENDLSWDMGIHKKYSLGDLVWDDINRDGIQDSDEPESKILR